jgi:hypothetical protein
MGKALEDHLIALQTSHLRPGMFIAALDRLWLHTPFPPDGFLVRDHKQISRIRRYCTYVYIDPNRYEPRPEATEDFEALPAHVLAPVSGKHSVGEEIPWARHALLALTNVVRGMIREVRVGRLPGISALNTGLLPVVDSIQRCPDALLWLMRTEFPHGYLCRRAVGTAITSAVYGYRLGFDRDSLKDLALGGILLDIGKTEVPVTILAKADNLTKIEYGLVKKHVGHANDMLRLTEEIPERVKDMVSCHHERFDGSGYPHRQHGTEIPLFARMAGIVDTYDAMTQERRYAPAVSAHTALRYLNGQRHSRFDDSLLQEFIHAMGVYPTGTWVELLDGSLGIVCAQDSGWPLTPRVALIADAKGAPLETRSVLADRHNPIVCARRDAANDYETPDLENIA